MPWQISFLAHRGAELSFSVLHKGNLYKREFHLRKLLSAVFTLYSTSSFSSSSAQADCSQRFHSPWGQQQLGDRSRPRTRAEPAPPHPLSPSTPLLCAVVPQCSCRQQHGHPSPSVPLVRVGKDTFHSWCSKYHSNYFFIHGSCCLASPTMTKRSFCWDGCASCFRRICCGTDLHLSWNNGLPLHLLLCLSWPSAAFVLLINSQRIWIRW